MAESDRRLAGPGLAEKLTGGCQTNWILMILELAVGKQIQGLTVFGVGQGLALIEKLDVEWCWRRNSACRWLPLERIQGPASNRKPMTLGSLALH